MPRLKPPPGRTAAAVVREKLEDESTDVLDQPQEKVEESDEAVLQPEQDASLAFKEQIEALKRSEQVQRERAEQALKDREAAIQRAKEREAEVETLRKQTVESQVEAVANALAAAKADAQSAKRDIAAAIESGDVQAQIAAYEKLATATSHVNSLEAGKAELEEKSKAPPVKEQTTNDPLEALQIPQKAKDWLRAHPEYMHDQEKNAQINWLHHKAVKKFAPYSDGYFQFIEEETGLRRKETPVAKVEADEDEGPAPVSAPVSREAPSSSSTPRKASEIRLSVQEKEAARLSGISEAEYAKQKLRLLQEKANGNYTGGQ